MTKLWSDWGIEAILQPTYVSAAFKIKNAPEMGVFLDYLNFWSLLHYPAGVVPVAKVEPGEDIDYQDEFNDRWTKTIRSDIQGSVGLPLSVTIVSQPYQDEIAVGIMKVLEEEVGFTMDPNL